MEDSSPQPRLLRYYRSPRPPRSSDSQSMEERGAWRTGFRPFLAETVRRVFGVDVRALAVLRMGTGILLLVDLCQRISDLTAFYSDGGVMPRSVLIERSTESPWCISFHLMSGQPAVELALLLAGAVCSAALVAGFRTRLFTILAWIFLLSLQYRNPMVLQGGDVLLRMILFWGIFLPWGERFSVSGARAPVHQKEALVSAATAALLLQICFVYWFAACLKSDPSWRRDFTAVYAAFSLDHFARPLAKLLLPCHRVLRFLTAGSFWLEAVGPAIGLLGAIITWQIRTAVVFVFMAFHASMALCLELGLFPLICSTAWLVFLPSPFWDWVERRLGAFSTPSRIAASLSGSRSFLFCRRWLAGHPLKARDRPLMAAMRNTLAALFLVYIFLWNLRTTDQRRFEKYLPHSLDWIGWISGMAQVWDMFSPSPLMEGGWFVMPAQLANGQEVDVFRNGASVSWDKPALVSSMYKNDRWRKYMVVIAAAANTSLRPPLGAYLCRRWNATHSKEEQITALRIILMEQDTLPERGYTAPRPILLWSGR